MRAEAIGRGASRQPPLSPSLRKRSLRWNDMKKTRPMLDAPPLPLAGRVGVGALSAMGFVEATPTRLALLGTLPRKREREGHTAGLIIRISTSSPARRRRFRKTLADAQQE